MSSIRVLGIDEAGRGCVLGDLVIAAFIVDGVEPQRLRDAGADDSKRLSPAQRLSACERLEALGTADVRTVSPAEIDMGNLNRLEERVIVELVREWKPDRVVLDALGPPNTFETTLQRLRTMACSTPSVEWTMEVGADAKHPVVGAASLFAKTKRDGLLETHRDDHAPLGSGYPSDPVTRRWLEQWARSGRPWPPFVRKRWHTVQALAQPSLFG